MGELHEWNMNGLQVVFPESLSQEPVDGLVQVEDTYRILSTEAPLPWSPPAEDAFEVMTRASLYVPLRQGQVLCEPVDNRRPCLTRLIAVLYDFDRVPPTDCGVVREGISRIFDCAEAIGIESLGLPYDFGLNHGGILEDEWQELLVGTCCERAPGLRRLRKLVLDFPPERKLRAGPAAVLFGVLLAKREGAAGGAGLRPSG